MKKAERIISKIKSNKSLLKAITKTYSWTSEETAIGLFVENAKDWTKHIKNKTMLCIVKGISSSGMSRKFYYTAFSGNGYRSFYSLLSCLDFRMNGECVVIGGCGMDMNFDTNYRIIYKLCALGIISIEQRNILCQMTPTCI